MSWGGTNLNKSQNILCTFFIVSCSHEFMVLLLYMSSQIMVLYAYAINLWVRVQCITENMHPTVHINKSPFLSLVSVIGSWCVGIWIMCAASCSALSLSSARDTLPLTSSSRLCIFRCCAYFMLPEQFLFRILYCITVSEEACTGLIEGL